MYLHNVYSPGSGEALLIHIIGDRIASIASNEAGRSSGEDHFEFEDAMILPGLINSHDHLDFNLFPKLGNRVYANYTEWGKDIHTTHKETIDQVLKVPESLRIRWGLFKNLLNG